MKTGLLDAPGASSAIVQLAVPDDAAAAERETRAGGASGSRMPAQAAADGSAVRFHARSFAEPLLAGRSLATGEPALAHADAVAAILHAIGAPPAVCAAPYLVYAADHLARPEDAIAQAFGASQASLAVATRRLMQLQRTAREADVEQGQRARQTERVRKMLLAFSRDLRVVLLRLASRLQTLRWHAAARTPCPRDVATESLQVFAPLANRLGIWPLKWELEDLAFRFLEPEAYRGVARLLDETRVDREQAVDAFCRRLRDDLAAHGLALEVQGRPKHLYSIWKKMRGKGLGFDRIFDLRAVRVIVDDVAACYAALGRIHDTHRPVPGEFDDYIARPKANGYQSLHTVVLDAAGRAVEVQIRTRAMHDHAEHGVAAHWAYKEAGAKGYAGIAAPTSEAQATEARKAVLRQLLAWERDLALGAAAATGDTGGEPPSGHAAAAADDRIYVFTPQAAVVELSPGATPVDFAYSLHTDLGHRCRGARVDGRVVPLNTPLASGQTVEITAAKEGGPSLDWLNAELGYLKSPRARAKVRAWFNLLAQRATVARGREAVEKLLQREGRTAVRLEELAARLGFKNADALFETVGKDEFSLRNIETVLRPPEPPRRPDDALASRRAGPVADRPGGGVLVVGVESLMTALARCCRPAPPDPIGGYVTRGRGVAVHRAACSNFRQMAGLAPERVIPVAWGRPPSDAPAVYPIDVLIEAADRQGLLRDISEVFAREKMNVVGVNSQSRTGSHGHRGPSSGHGDGGDHGSGGATARMMFTVEAADLARLAHVLRLVQQVAGVRSARRK